MMGIEQSYRRITANELDRLLIDASWGEKFLWDGHFDYVQRDARELANRYLDIQKEWQELHFLLTGEVTFQGQSQVPLPLRNAIMGGHDTQYEATYDYHRYLTPEEVKEVAGVLNQILPEDLRTRYKQYSYEPHAYARPISPEEWGEGDWKSILELYSQLTKFFDEAAKENDVVIVCNL
jgi:hypothetical protein